MTKATSTKPVADRGSRLVLPIAVLLGLVVATATGQLGARWLNLPVTYWTVTWALTLNWVAFVPAYRLQSERFYDLIGSVTFLTTTIIAAVLSAAPDLRIGIVLLAIIIWAIRLGTFLYARVRNVGSDQRFDAYKSSPLRFLNVWTMQGLWVIITLAPAIAAIVSFRRLPWDAFAWTGLCVWICGFALEVVADTEKRRFRADPNNTGHFIRSGVWSWCRHPNYLGEIVLWTGITIMVIPVLEGWAFLSLLSPVFVAILLIRISGIPLLEDRADQRWGHLPEYQAYKNTTPRIIPRIPSR